MTLHEIRRRGGGGRKRGICERGINTTESCIRETDDVVGPTQRREGELRWRRDEGRVLWATFRTQKLFVKSIKMHIRVYEGLKGSWVALATPSLQTERHKGGAEERASMFDQPSKKTEKRSRVGLCRLTDEDQRPSQAHSDPQLRAEERRESFWRGRKEVSSTLQPSLSLRVESWALELIREKKRLAVGYSRAILGAAEFSLMLKMDVGSIKMVEKGRREVKRSHRDL